jgi:hypothetical protein
MGVGLKLGGKYKKYLEIAPRKILAQYLIAF